MSLRPWASRVEVRLEGILGHPALEPGTGPGRALEEGRLVVAGPGVAAGAALADVAGEHQRQIGFARFISVAWNQWLIPSPWWMATGLMVAMSFASCSMSSRGAAA